jgi:ATP-dependent Clp protease ATP-binding subunit ClpB
VDETVIFHRLEKEHLRHIADIQLNHVRALLAKRNISIALTEAATDLLIDEGYDPVYGARPLKRVLQRRIVDPLALEVIQGEVRDGDHVVVDRTDGELSFNVVDAVDLEEPQPR